MGFWRETGQHFFSSLFLFFIIFLQDYVGRALILYGKIGRGYVEGNHQELKILIIKSCQYLQVEDLLRLLVIKLIVNSKTHS
jgi:hypothetical protein